MHIKMTTHRIFGVLVLLASLALPVVTQAAICTVTANEAAFGAYDPFAAQSRDSSTTVEISCSGSNGESVSFDILASTGLGTFTDRLAANGHSNLHYNLFLDISRTQVWGDGSNGTVTLHDSLTIADRPVTRTYTIYGRITSAQRYITAGTYSDQVTVTMRY